MVAIAACAETAPRVPEYPPLEEVPSSSEPAPVARPVTITVIGTNDVHGHFERLDAFAGHLEVLRAVREDDGGVVLVDGGDMWQGTLASNLDEGASMVRLYGLLGYDAATIGNHEFDYGPVGPRATPGEDAPDPRGALLARAAEARFPVLAANFLDAESGAPVQWPNVQPTVTRTIAGVKVGIIGTSTAETLHTTISANVRDLRMAPQAETITAHARRLRDEGAQVVLVATHAGGKCQAFDDPEDVSSCDEDEELFALARALEPGLVDVIVGGHTHQAVAHRVNGIALIESYALGHFFGRVDLVVEDGRVTSSTIHPPHRICEGPANDCAPEPYEGRAVQRVAAIAEAVAPAVEAAREQRERPLGVTLPERIGRNYQRESPLGNLLADLMLEARPGADLALLNAGGVRASFDPGPLTYGGLYETFPFDNRFATVRMRVSELRAVLAQNIQSTSGTLIVSGIRVRARCRGAELRVELRDRRGRVLRDDQELTVRTSDYLATTNSFEGLADRTEIEEGGPMRDAIAERLTERGGELRPEASFDPERPRIDLPGPRPVRCE